MATRAPFSSLRLRIRLVRVPSLMTLVKVLAWHNFGRAGSTHPPAKELERGVRAISAKKSSAFGNIMMDILVTLIEARNRICNDEFTHDHGVERMMRLHRER